VRRLRTGLPLADALGVRPGDVVSFVGAGGKTTAMVCLAWELVNAGRGVVLTTTTHIREPIITQARVILLEEDADVILALLPGLVRRHRLVALASGYAPAAAPDSPDPYRKLRGVPPDLIGQVAALDGVDHVLVEADGARGRSLKAPDRNEPVVPPSTGLLVPVAGVDCVGRVLDETVAFRLPRVAALSGVRAGDAITTTAVASVLGCASGGLKGRPRGARVAPLLNKTETSETERAALEIATLLLASPAISRVVWGAAAAKSPRFGCAERGDD
jgi:molybdenum cofactor cytidylyltransferase